LPSLFFQASQPVFSSAAIASFVGAAAAGAVAFVVPFEVFAFDAFAEFVAVFPAGASHAVNAIAAAAKSKSDLKNVMGFFSLNCFLL
jgi:hypothetical protein